MTFDFISQETRKIYLRNKLKNAGFTLAEVLITLGIIGVVAAMTMPVLIAEHREKKTVVQLKKAYSILQQAYLMAINKYGDSSTWSRLNTQTGTDDDGNAITDYSSAYTVFQYLAENMKGLNPQVNKKPVFTYDSYTLDGTYSSTISPNKNIPNIYLADGTLISSGWITDNSMDFYVLLNGCERKGKCIVGKDIFYFTMLFNTGKIIPSGSPRNALSSTDFKNLCNRSKYNVNNGKRCTAWVILNENMDYLHCDDLDWGVKTKCK